MIFYNINFDNMYAEIDKDLIKCLNYAKNNALEKYENGRYEIEGNDIFVNIVEYETFEEKDRVWEAHKEYIDIHMMLRGTETIAVAFVQDLVQGKYVKEDDFLPLYGTSNSKVSLQFGDFLICYPLDAHKPAIKVEEKAVVKKAIFKVKIKR